MKILVMVSMIIFSFSACSKENSKEKSVAKKAESKDAVVVKGVKAEAPCDTKEDLIKKLEEKKKAAAEAAKPKGFSLQGGDTGCTIK